MTLTTPARLSVAELKRLRALTTKKGRSTAATMLIEGWKSLSDAFMADWPIERVVFEIDRNAPAHGRDLLERIQGRRVPVREAPARIMRELGATVHGQGVIAEVRRRTWTLDDLDVRQDRPALVLDGVGDPGNVGTLIRAADWFDCAGVILGPLTALANNDKVVRAASGSMFHLPVLSVADLSATLRELRRRGWTIVGTEVRGSPATKMDELPRRVALVLGSEAHGLSDAVRELVDVSVTIPRHGRAESLNVAVAGGILLARMTG